MKKGTVAWLILGGGAIVTLLLFRTKISEAVQDWETRIFLNRLSPYQSMVSEYADEFSLDENLAKALIWRESSGYPNARRWEGEELGYSYGFTGLTLPAAQDVGYTGEAEGLLDPETNLHYGFAYLRMWLEECGEDIAFALSCYNGGYKAYYYKLETGEFLNPSYVEKVLEYQSRLIKK